MTAATQILILIRRVVQTVQMIVVRHRHHRQVVLVRKATLIRHQTRSKFNTKRKSFVWIRFEILR